MLIIRRGLLKIAIIDPSKKMGEYGEYITYFGEETDIAHQILTARLTGKEIRYYYKDLTTREREVIPAEVIVAEIPPGGYIQPFHTHKNIHEITVINQGELVVVESDDSREDYDLEKIKSRGALLKKGDMVIQSPGARHTCVNAGGEYTVVTTIKIARIPLEEFSADWIGKK